MTLLKNLVDILTAPGGPLNDTVALNRWIALTDEIENAVVAESARWGDALESIDGITRTRDIDWQVTVDEISGFLNGNADALKDSLEQEGYY